MTHWGLGIATSNEYLFDSQNPEPMKILQLTLLLQILAQVCFGQQLAVNYTELDSAILNPSRGFYKYTYSNSSMPNPLDSAWLANVREVDSISIIFRYVYLDDSMDAPIAQSFLDLIEEDFEAMRKTGFKVILRFAYSDFLPANPPYLDSPGKARVLSHIEQLRTILQDNSDIILTLQNGFWGVWGENFFSDAFGTSFGSSVISPAQWADRKEVTDSLLSVMPKTSLISLRYPELKANFFGLTLPQDSITLATAHDQSDLSRLGYHNDCFLVAANDYTFGNTSVEKPFWEGESRYTIMGGESCGDDSTYTNCVNALTDLENAHWTYANDYYHPDVLTRWKQEGCFEEIWNRLGYRFVMESGSFDTTVSRGGNFNFAMNLRNEGFAATVEEKGINLVFNNSDTTLYFNLNTDSRYWFPNQVTTLQETLSIPAGVPLGSYDLHLELTDVNPSLEGEPIFSLRMANEQTWDAEMGWNSLNVQVAVQDSLVGIEREHMSAALKIYPNPSSDGKFILQNMGSGPSVPGEILVVDLLGKEMLRRELLGSETNELDLSGHADGIYLLKIGGRTVKQVKN